MAMVATRSVNDANKTSGIWMDVDASGNPVYGMTSPAKFLEALGVKDYIVEQGTSGGWTYRKWNSGIAECWGRVPLVIITGNYSETQVVIPFNMINTDYVVSLTPSNNGSALSTPVRECGVNSGNSVRTVNSFYISAHVSSQYDVLVETNVIGRWK